MWNMQTIGTPQIDLKDPHSHKKTHRKQNDSSSFTSFIAILLVLEHKCVDQHNTYTARALWQPSFSNSYTRI